MVTTLVVPLRDLDDTALVALCIRHEPGAMEILIKRHLKSVYTYLVHTVHDSHWAEDLTQETFLRAVQSLHRFDTRRPFQPWLYAIATNVSRTAKRKNQTLPRWQGDNVDQCLANVPETRASFQPDAQVSDPQMVHEIREALYQMPPAIRQAMILRHVYDLPYDAIAQTLSANLNTVRTWLRRGREALKDTLHPIEGEPQS